MNMNLKGIMNTLGAKPGQVMSDPYARAWAPTPSPIKEAEGEDHEVSMAQNSLDTIIKMATELKAKMGKPKKIFQLGFKTTSLIQKTLFLRHRLIITNILQTKRV